MKTITLTAKSFYWKRIQLISFVLAVFIIIRHNSSIYNYDAPEILSIYESFKYSITEIAVPLFFIISGFNFFNHFSIADQKRKFKNRIKSLLVPYVIWNTIFCVFCIITSFDFFSRFFIGREKFIITPINIIWGCIFHMGCNSQFWFVFTLMVCVILNPIIYYIIRNKQIGILFLLLLFVVIMIFGLRLPEYFFYRTDAFLYYYFGAFLGLHCSKHFYEDSPTPEVDYKEKKFFIRVITSNSFRLISGIVFLCFSLLLLLPGIHPGIRFFLILIASYGFWNFSICCKFFKMKWLPQGGTTFLMYAAHGILQPIIVKLIYLVLPKSSWISIANFFLAITLTVLVCIALRKFMQRFCPVIDKLLTGWRR